MAWTRSAANVSAIPGSGPGVSTDFPFLSQAARVSNAMSQRIGEIIAAGNSGTDTEFCTFKNSVSVPEFPAAIFIHKRASRKDRVMSDASRAALGS